MKLFTWIFSLLLVCTTQTAFAYSQGACCPSDPCEEECCTFRLYGDYLYWTICRSELDYDDYSTKYVNPGYDSGFRFGGSILCDKKDLSVRYTYLDTSEKKTFENHNFYGDGYDEDCFRKYNFCADIVDIEVGGTVGDECTFMLRPFLGAKLAWIDEKTEKCDYEYTSKEKLKFEGYGLSIGFEGKMPLYCGLSFVLRTSWAILHSDFKVNRDSCYCDYCDNRETECLFVPVQEHYVGLDYTTCGFCDSDFFFQVGYEVQSWGSWREFDSDTDIASLGFDGLVLRLGFDF